ncbi:MAG: DUF433 domain-containing protein [Candidatus Nealsonbacteria bacterium]
MTQDYSTTTSVIKSDSSGKEKTFNVPHEAPITSPGVHSEDEVKSIIESNPSIQGGTYCLRGTRVTIPGVMEARKKGRTIDETVKTLKKYFGVDISKEKLQQGIDEYQRRVSLIGD